MRYSNSPNKGISTLSIVRTAAEVSQDNAVITFGQYKGKNWNQVAEVNAQYVVWAYDTIKNRSTCSLPLARACGYADYSQKVPQSTSDEDDGYIEDEQI